MKDNQIKQLLILKDVMMTFYKIIYLVADFVGLEHTGWSKIVKSFQNF